MKSTKQGGVLSEYKLTQISQQDQIQANLSIRESQTKESSQSFKIQKKIYQKNIFNKRACQKEENAQQETPRHRRQYTKKSGKINMSVLDLN